MNNNIKVSEKILPVFHDVWKACNDIDILNVVCKGGRNSSKSTTISIRLIYNRMKYKSHALVIRKVDKSLRKSCREQLIWAIEHLGVQGSWSYGSSPACDMTLTYIPTGTKIFFEGANNPVKLKSWKTSDYPTTELWYEEAEEFKTEEEISTINNSFLRSELPEGLFHKFYYTYNPPKRKQSWLNKKYESQFQARHTFVHHSDYRTNPFVSEFFKIEAEHIKETNSRRYDWEYLGLPIGGGVVPFENLVFREITDDEYSTFDNIKQGVDWGYATDPLAFVRLHYDKTRRKIYFMDEIYGVKMSNREFCNVVKSRMYDRTLTIADSAEPKSIDECKENGLYIQGAKKGQGSVEHGEKWLDDLEEIVIDYKRTPNIAREFENIDYQVDKDGNVKGKLEDKDNHSIDATRYSLSQCMAETDAIIF
jgi:PBSX family phage terminase large subunit